MDYNITDRDVIAERKHAFEWLLKDKAKHKTCKLVLSDQEKLNIETGIETLEYTEKSHKIYNKLVENTKKEIERYIDKYFDRFIARNQYDDCEDEFLGEINGSVFFNAISNQEIREVFDFGNPGFIREIRYRRENSEKLKKITAQVQALPEVSDVEKQTQESYKDKVKVKFYKSLCKIVWREIANELLETYFDQAFETGKLPGELVSKLEELNKSSGDVFKFNLKQLNGLVQNTAKQVSETIKTLTIEDIGKHTEDIVAFAEIETLCSLNCNCEMTCEKQLTEQVESVRNKQDDMAEFVATMKDLGLNSYQSSRLLDVLCNDKTLQEILNRITMDNY